MKEYSPQPCPCPTAGGNPPSLQSDQLSEAEESAEHVGKAVIQLNYLMFAFRWGSVCVWMSISSVKHIWSNSLKP